MKLYVWHNPWNQDGDWDRSELRCIAASENEANKLISEWYKKNYGKKLPKLRTPHIIDLPLVEELNWSYD